MWRALFALGGLTGLIVAMAVVLPPLPMAGSASGEARRMPVPGTYRMDGDVVFNTCTFDPAPLSRQWRVEAGALRIGERRLAGRMLSNGMVYESVRKSVDGCMAATWEVKLMPVGRGVEGSVIWEVWKAEPTACDAAVSRPCMMKFSVQGLPTEIRQVGG